MPRAVVVSGLTLVGVGAAFAVAAWLGVRPSEPLGGDLGRLLTTTAAGLCLPAGLFFLVRSRHESRQASIAMASGVLMLAFVTLGGAELSPLLASGSETPIEAMRAWSVVAVLAAFALGVCDDPADRECRRLMALPAAVVLAAVLMAGLPSQGGMPPTAALLLGWFAVGVAHALAYLKTGQPHRAWIALGVLGLLLGELGHTATAAPELWAIQADVVRVIGMLMMIGGLVGDLELQQWRQRQQLASTAELVADMRAVTDAVQRSLEERDHEARSALAAIEYTARAMQRLGGSVRRQDLEQLENAMLTEIELLRRLVTMTSPRSEIAAFDLGGTVRAVAAAEAATGMNIEVVVLAPVFAMGVRSATAEVVQCLLENARRHAPGSRVTISIIRRGPYAITQVEDEGPGVPPERRREIFARGRDGGHPTSVGGRGLGLYIAARLAREQRGELWVEEAASGGASFRLALAAADPDVATSTDADDVTTKSGVAMR